MNIEIYFFQDEKKVNLSSNHRFDVFPYSISAETFPLWSWLPAKTYHGVCNDVAENTCSNVC